MNIPPNPPRVGATPVPGPPAASTAGQAAPVVAARSSAPAAPSTPPVADSQALIARVDAYAAGIAERLANAFQAAPEGSQADFRGAVAGFEQNLGRVRAGIEDGTLRGPDLASAVQGTIGALQGQLARATTPVQEAVEADARDRSGADAAPAADAASVSQGRFQNIARSMTARLQSLEAPEAADDAQATLAAAQQTFESSIARIENAFFENGDFDRGTFYGLFSASLGRLQQNLSELFSGTQKAEATLYDSQQGLSSLSDGLKRVRFDRTV